jgi:hypothetical protein
MGKGKFQFAIVKQAAGQQYTPSGLCHKHSVSSHYQLVWPNFTPTNQIGTAMLLLHAEPNSITTGQFLSHF